MHELLPALFTRNTQHAGGFIFHDFTLRNRLVRLVQWIKQSGLFYFNGSQSTHNTCHHLKKAIVSVSVLITKMSQPAIWLIGFFPSDLVYNVLSKQLMCWNSCKHVLRERLNVWKV